MKLSRRGKWLLGVLIGLGILSALTNKTPPASTPPPAEADGVNPDQGIVAKLNQSDKLTVEDLKFARGQFGNIVITGVLKNPTAKQFKYAQVEINLYDKGGAQVGSTLANANNIEPGGRWKFEAAVLQTDVARAEVKGITAF